jgi:hypothetical protein
MRLIGNKTHGDLAEIGIAEFINQFMYDFHSEHVGKDLFRAKEHEEDIVIINELTHTKIPVSLKAYGDGPLQLSTDKNKKMFLYLEGKGKIINDKKVIEGIFASDAFAEINNLNIMPLIYDEKKQICNIMIFNYEKCRQNTSKIIFIDKDKKFDHNKQIVISGKGREHPIYLFVDANGCYICEVRYGGATANALQRGFWTHTKNALSYFDSLTNGWIDYSHNLTLVELFRLTLNSSAEGHKQANEILQKDIDRLKAIK